MELKDAMEMHDFFKVVAYSSTLLESYGKQILIKYYKKINKHAEGDLKRIQQLSFYVISITLYLNKIVDRPLFDDLNGIREARNKQFIHIENNLNFNVLSNRKVKDLENLAHKSIRCVTKLIAKNNDMDD